MESRSTLHHPHPKTWQVVRSTTTFVQGGADSDPPSPCVAAALPIHRGNHTSGSSLPPVGSESDAPCSRACAAPRRGEPFGPPPPTPQDVASRSIHHHPRPRRGGLRSAQPMCRGGVAHTSRKPHLRVFPSSRRIGVRRSLFESLRRPKTWRTVRPSTTHAPRRGESFDPPPPSSKARPSSHKAKNFVTRQSETVFTLLDRSSTQTPFPDHPSARP